MFGDPLIFSTDKSNELEKATTFEISAGPMMFYLHFSDALHKNKRSGYFTEKFYLEKKKGEMSDVHRACFTFLLFNV